MIHLSLELKEVPDMITNTELHIKKSLRLAEGICPQKSLGITTSLDIFAMTFSDNSPQKG